MTVDEDPDQTLDIKLVHEHLGNYLTHVRYVAIYSLSKPIHAQFRFEIVRAT